MRWRKIISLLHIRHIYSFLLCNDYGVISFIFPCLSITTFVSSSVHYLKRPGAVLDAGCIVAYLSLDDPSRVQQVSKCAIKLYTAFLKVNIQTGNGKGVWEWVCQFFFSFLRSYGLNMFQGEGKWFVFVFLTTLFLSLNFSYTVEKVTSSIPSPAFTVNCLWHPCVFTIYLTPA